MAQTAEEAACWHSFALWKLRGHFQSLDFSRWKEFNTMDVYSSGRFQRRGAAARPPMPLVLSFCFSLAGLFWKTSQSNLSRHCDSSHFSLSEYLLCPPGLGSLVHTQEDPQECETSLNKSHKHLSLSAASLSRAAFWSSCMAFFTIWLPSVSTRRNSRTGTSKNHQSLYIHLTFPFDFVAN